LPVSSIVTCPGIAKTAEQGEPISIDLEKNEISSQRRDWHLACDPLPGYVKSVLGKGGLIKFLEDRIAIK
jgi:3-isopropylmalate dehydratase small subunit